ncbi:MAG: hypothetical protein J0I87_14370 [Cellulomonas sp.]|nr:hypothetical protein [Cellulomonas sp.]
MVERTPLAAPTVELGDELPPIDPSKPAIISAWGRKGSGKSVFNRRLFDSWPWDKLAIDVNGDADPGPDATKVTTPLPGRFPAPPEPVPGGPRPGPRTLVWCGEIGEFMPTAQRTGPHMRRLLMQNRHYHTTALFDGPRPMNVNPLVLAQSDLVAIFHLPNPADQERVADTIGYPPARFHEECETTWRRGKYWFLLWHAEAHALYRCAPLPPLER